MTNIAVRSWTRARAALGVCCGLTLAGSAATVPTGTHSSAAGLDARYGALAARHIYENFRLLVHPGPLPVSLQAVTTLEVTIGMDGMVRQVQHIGSATDRPQITPWIVMLVQASQPFPAAPQGEVVYRDTWRITAEGRFQLDAAGDARDLLASGRQR